jgi:hypothetical protein
MLTFGFRPKAEVRLRVIDDGVDPNETPAVEAALISESAIWVPASLATIPVFTVVERSGASVGVILRN